MSKQPFLTIILGSDENAYGDVRLLKEAYGVRPLLLCQKLLIPTLYSRLFDVRCIKDFDTEEIFVPMLLSVLREMEDQYEKIVVIACSDYYANLMSRHYSAFENRIANRFPDIALLEQFETKDKFYALCEKHGMPYPKTVICEADERKTVLSRLPFDFPIVAKPENSNATAYLHLSFEGKKKVYFLNTPEEYLKVADALDGAGYRGKLILQEFIEGKDSAMRVVNSYSDKNGIVRASVLGQPLLEEYAPYTLGNYAAIISRNDARVYREVTSFLEKIGYVGFSNFDMKYDQKRDRYVLFEINPRLGRSSFFVRAAGINMMKELVDSVVFGKEHDPVFGEKEAMWSNVPMGVLKRYVKDPILKKEIGTLSKSCLYTLFEKGDLSLKRLYRITRFYLSHYKNFKKYYFEK